MSDPIVGIDLGTSNSVVAHADAAGIVKVLADDSGYKVHPSVVSFHPNGGVVVGAAAKQRRVLDPQNTIYSVKRLIGRSYRSPEVQTAKSRSPFLIKEGPNNAPTIVTRGGEFAVPEISAIVLDHVRNIASARLEVPVSRAVVTVPASFNDAQRSATATAGAIAGLTVVRVLNEPTAAALAYGHTRQLRQIIAVYDFGGGTFDITLLKLDDQVYEVLGTSGDTFLGGDDLDERLVDKMVSKFLAENRIDLRTNEVSMMRLRAVAEQTKIELSRRSRAVVRIDEIAYGPRGAPLNLQIEISRDEFVKEVADIIDRTFPVCTEALALAGLSTDRISDVILVGGTSKIPYVRDQVSKYFGKAPRGDVNPEDAVAAGAALQATSLERILSRRPSSRVAAASAPEEETTAQGLADVLELAPSDAPSEESDASGATMAPSELTVSARPKRPTASYHETPRSGSEITKPDTSYSMTRSSVRNEVEDLDERQPLGRMARPQAATPPPIPAAAPIPSAPDPSRPVTVPGAAIPPPLPRRGAGGAPARPMPFQHTVPLPPIQREPDMRTPILPYPPVLPTSPRPQPIPPTPISGAFEIPPAEWTDDSGVGTSPEAWGGKPPGSTKPMAPTSPIAPPTAPTLVAVAADAALGPTARGFAAPTPVAGPSAASTARGFPAPQVPQSFPIQPPPQARPAPLPAPPPRPPPILLEVTPRGLGIATVAGYCEELIRRNARVPTEAKRMFTTSRDQQELVHILVCQGESRRLDNNTVIGDLVLQGLPARPRGETSIEVTFAIDASGVLHVRARDAQTGAEQHASLALVGDVAQEDVATSRDRLQQLRR